MYVLQQTTESQLLTSRHTNPGRRIAMCLLVSPRRMSLLAFHFSVEKLCRLGLVVFWAFLRLTYLRSLPICQSKGRAFHVVAGAFQARLTQYYQSHDIMRIPILVTETQNLNSTLALRVLTFYMTITILMFNVAPHRCCLLY